MDLMPLEYVICLLALTFHKEVGLYIMSRKNQVLLDNFISEVHSGSQRKSSSKKQRSTSDLLPSQAQGTQNRMEYNT